MEYHIYNIPLFVIGEAPKVSLPDFCTEVEETIPQRLLCNIDVVYVGDLRELNGRNATYANAAIYMTNKEPTTEDMLENFIHEVAHSLEHNFASEIYTDDLIKEFKGKRSRLFHILKSHGYDVSPISFGYTEYNVNFDKFLSDTVGKLGLRESPRLRVMNIQPLEQLFMMSVRRNFSRNKSMKQKSFKLASTNNFKS